MKTTDILERMKKGDVLCCGYEDEEKVYWLEPRRLRIRSDQAEKIISLPGLKASGDGLFDDAYSQTWKLA